MDNTQDNEYDLPSPPGFDSSEVPPSYENLHEDATTSVVRELSKTVNQLSDKVDQMYDWHVNSKISVVDVAPKKEAPIQDDVKDVKFSLDAASNGVTNPAFDGDLQEDTKKGGFFQEDENEERGNWSGKLDFIMASLGYAVGLGNVWRFPYLCYQNGGGAFFIPYLIMLVFVGLPIFYLELSLGQFSSSGPLTCFRFSPIFSGLGIGMVCVSGLVAIYYNVIISWAVYYLVLSFFKITTGELPWGNCDPEWANWLCADYVPDVACNTTGFIQNETGLCYNETSNQVVGMWNATKADEEYNITRQTSSQQFFNYEIMNLSGTINDVGSLQWKNALCLLASWILVTACLIKGVKSSGKVVYFTAMFPYVVLVILFINGMTLDGMGDGIYFYVNPKWEKLADAKVWIDAAVQIFFSLGICFGGLQTLSSYNRFHTNTLRDTLIVALGNCGTSIFAGFVIFAYLGYMAKQLGTTVDKVVDAGVGLAFAVYPHAVLSLPFPPIWSILFFIMLLTLGLGSQFAQVETVTTALQDRFPKLREKKSIVVVCVAVFMYLIGLSMCTEGGSYILTIFDNYAGGWAVLLIGIFECISIAWVYGFNRFANDIRIMTGRRPIIWWRILWSFVTPVLLVGILIFNWVSYTPLEYADVPMAFWANIIGWSMTIGAASAFPIMAVIRIFRAPGDNLLQKFLSVVKPKWNWGPALEKHRRLVDYVDDFVYDISDPNIAHQYPGSTYDLEALHAVDSEAQLVTNVIKDTSPVTHRNNQAFTNQAFDNKE